MTDQPFKLRFDGKGCLARVDFAANPFAKDDDPPLAYLAAVRTKMLEYQEQGVCRVFEIFDGRFKAACERLRRLRTSPAISVVVAAGAPPLEGVSFAYDVTGQKPVGRLSLSTDRNACRAWVPHWLHIAFRSYLAERGFDFTPDPAAIEGARVRYAFLNEEVTEYIIPAAPITDPSDGEKSWSLRAFRHRQQIDVLLGPGIQASDLMEIERALYRRAIELGSNLLDVDSFFLDPSMLKALCQEAITGHTKIALECPYVIPGALFFSSREAKPTRKPGRGDVIARLALPFAPRTDPTIEAFKRRIESIAPGDAGCVSMDIWRARGLVRAGAETGAIVVSPERIPLPLKVHSDVVPEGYRELMNRSSVALEETPASQRTMQSMTIAIHERHRSDIASMQSAFALDLVNSSVPIAQADRLLQLNLQLFPLTRLHALPDGLTESTPNKASERLCGLLLRELVGIDGFRSDPKWIGARLYPHLSRDQIVSGLVHLTKSEMLKEVGGKGRYSQVSRNVRTQETVGGESILQFHREMIDLSIASIAWAPPERRQYVFLTVPVNAETWESILAKTQQHLQGIFNMAANVDLPEQLYQVGLHAFPLLMS